eukprot:SAG11_NODE_6994_length_1211_cov_30.327338_2_plen_90_part_00
MKMYRGPASREPSDFRWPEYTGTAVPRYCSYHVYYTPGGGLSKFRNSHNEKGLFFSMNLRITGTDVPVNTRPHSTADGLIDLQYPGIRI